MFFSKRKERHPYLLTSLYLFNPAVIYLSSVWGQIEPITNFFLLLSFYLVLMGKTDRVRTSSIIFFTLAVLTKQTALWFAPFYLFIWLKNLPVRGLISGFLASIAVFFVGYLPFGLLPSEAIKSYLATLGGSSSGVSDAAWNFWFLLFPGGSEDSVRLGLFSVRWISIVLLILLLGLLIYRLIKHYSLRTFLTSLFLWSLAVFLLQTRVHERHLAPALVFGLLAFVGNPLWWIWYLALSLFHFLNLFLTLKIPFI
jgi:Gpi18-like mannosyltransferase